MSKLSTWSIGPSGPSGQGLKISRSQGLRVSGSQGLKVSRFQGLKISRFQGLKISRSQGLKVSRRRVKIPHRINREIKFDGSSDDK